MKRTLVDVLFVLFLMSATYFAVIGIWKLCLIWGWHA